MWGGPNKKPRIRWDIMLLPVQDGVTGIEDRIMTIDAGKITILKRLITRNRQPWMRFIEYKLK